MYLNGIYSVSHIKSIFYQFTGGRMRAPNEISLKTTEEPLQIVISKWQHFPITASMLFYDIISTALQQHLSTIVSFCIPKKDCCSVSVQARNFSFGAQGPLPSKMLGTFEKIWGQYNQRSKFYRKCTCCFQMWVFCSM